MTINDYRIIAADCIRHASDCDCDDGSALWATLARSWLKLAQQAEQANISIVADGEPYDDSEVANDIFSDAS